MAKPDSLVHDAIFDLEAIARDLRGEEAYLANGHTARTLIRVSDLRLVLVAMRAGSEMSEHRANETASVHVLSGKIQLGLPERSVGLGAGHVLTMPKGRRHSVKASEESVFLLTLGWRGDS